MRISRTSSTNSDFIDASVAEVTVDVVAKIPLLGIVINASDELRAPPSGCCCNITFCKKYKSHHDINIQQTVNKLYFKT